MGSKVRRGTAAVLVAVAFVAAACGGGDSDPEGRSERRPAPAAGDGVPADGDSLAAVDGVGEVLTGYTTDLAATVTATKAGKAPKIDGVLEAGPGLAVDVDGTYGGRFQVRLDVPAPPTDDAVPVVLHQLDDGSAVVEPALWDPVANQMVVWTDGFSDRWGAWYDPRNWAEEVVQVGQGAFDWTADYITGRTDPPACENNAPSWFHTTPRGMSSVHVCTKSNPAPDGAVRGEVLLKSNRSTAQVIRLPDVAKDYVWNSQPEDLALILTGLSGVDDETNRTLLGGDSMSVGVRQPATTVNASMQAYLTPVLIVANPLFALVGNLPTDGVIGLYAASAKCVQDISGVDVLRFDLTPVTDVPDFDDLLRCAIEALQEPELVYGMVLEAAKAVGVTTDLPGVLDALTSIAPTFVRFATGAAIASSLVNAWDGTADQLADGTLDMTLDAPAPPPTMAPPSTSQRCGEIQTEDGPIETEVIYGATCKTAVEVLGGLIGTPPDPDLNSAGDNRWLLREWVCRADTKASGAIVYTCEHETAAVATIAVDQ